MKETLKRWKQPTAPFVEYSGRREGLPCMTYHNDSVSRGTSWDYLRINRTIAFLTFVRVYHSPSIYSRVESSVWSLSLYLGISVKFHKEWISQTIIEILKNDLKRKTNEEIMFLLRTRSPLVLRHDVLLWFVN